MYTLLKKTTGDAVAVMDSDFDLGIMLTMYSIHMQMNPGDVFNIVDTHGTPVWPAA